MKHGIFQKQVKEQLESQAAFVINITGHRMQKNGLPDLDITHRKWKGRIEIKVGKDPARPLQRIQAVKFELRGVPVYVLRCVETCVETPRNKGDDHWLMGEHLFIYTLENFEDEVNVKFSDLSSLLQILIDLELDKEKQRNANKI